jgi:hypothetical protein
VRTRLSRRGRTFTANDNVGKPCNCLECQAAGVTDKAIRFVPADEFHPKARWLHGSELKSWYEAYERAQTEMRAVRDKLGLDPKKLKAAVQGQ